jgi:hypothetical protein
MPQTTTTYRVLIASPNDTNEERQLISSVLHEWNTLHTTEYGIVFLPNTWELHSSPELGDRAQAIINRQVVDTSDLLIGVFWTRLGTPTGEADSGTIEEIERCVAAGKPVLLYFRNSPIPQSADLEQFKRVQDFKARIFKQGLTDSYESSDDLREKLLRHLLAKTRDMFAQSAGDSAANSTRVARYPATVGLSYRVEKQHRIRSSHVDQHDYELQVRVKNAGTRTIRNWHVDVEVPKGFRQPHVILSAEQRDRGSPSHFLVRFSEGPVLYPGDERTFTIPYMMNEERLHQGDALLKQLFRATLFVDDELVDRCETAADQLTNF